MKRKRESKNLGDADIAQRVLDGDRDAFESLIERYIGLVWTISRRFAASDDEAYDVSQEVFVRAYENLNKFDINRTFANWLYVIALNVARNARRTRESAHRTMSVESADVLSGDPDPLELLILSDEAERVRNHLAQLPRKQCETFILHSINGFKLKEVAEMMGCSEGTARSNYFEAVRKLAQILHRKEERR